ncbi:MAG: DUF3575 domain-containing protein [Flavicella sp.]
MKKITLFLLFIASLKAHAQSNEIKIDILDIIAIRALDITYEHNINDESSVGISALFNLEKESANFRYNEEFVLTPYYRHYFSSTNNLKMFGDFYGALNTGNIPERKLKIGDDDTYTDFAAGLGVGVKYTSDSGFVVDVHVGAARNLFNTDYSKEVVPRVGISLGKQF